MENSGNAVALVGIIATASVAVLGLVVQLGVAWATRRQERRRARYGEFVVLYERIAARLSFIYQRVSAYVEEGESMAGVAEELDDMLHLAFMMELHRAPTSVMDAWNQLDRHFSDLGRLVADPSSERGTAILRGFGDDIRSFYRSCGEHLNRVWPAATPRNPPSTLAGSWRDRIQRRRSGKEDG